MLQRTQRTASALIRKNIFFSPRFYSGNHSHDDHHSHREGQEPGGYFLDSKVRKLAEKPVKNSKKGKIIAASFAL